MRLRYSGSINHPLLISYLGYPGSGKTYFSKQLASKLNAVTFNTDALRLSVFGSQERIDHVRLEDRTRIYEDIFGAMNYATKQTLLAGHSVIYDAQMTKREDRINIVQLAESAEALPLLVWVRTSRETALRRGQEREPGDDSIRYTAEKTAYLIDRFDDITDLPEANENLIEISGEVDFEEQYASFLEQLKRYSEEEVRVVSVM